MDGVPTLRRPWTVDDLADIEDELHRYEVVDGALVVIPRPAIMHNDVVRRLFRQLDAQAGPAWEATTEVQVRLGTDSRIADVGLVATELSISRREYAYLPRDIGLLVEVVSPSSRKTDRFAKPAEYAEAGVPFFWRVETEPELLLVGYRLEAGGYVLAVEATSGVVTAPGPVPLRIDVDALRRSATGG